MEHIVSDEQKEKFEKMLENVAFPEIASYTVCPKCGNTMFLEPQWLNEEYFDEFFVASDYFSCKNCGIGARITQYYVQDHKTITFDYDE